MGRRDRHHRERHIDNGAEEKAIIERIKFLGSKELNLRLGQEGLAGVERRCIEKVLKSGMTLWASDDGKLVIRRTIGEDTDFEIVERVLDTNLKHGMDTYEKALDVVEWLTREKK